MKTVDNDNPSDISFTENIPAIIKDIDTDAVAVTIDIFIYDDTSTSKRGDDVTLQEGEVYEVYIVMIQ